MDALACSGYGSFRRSAEHGQADGLPHALRKGADGAGFVFVNIEDGVEFGDLQQVLHPFVEVEQLQLTAVVGYRGEARDQLTDPRAVDIRDIAQVKQDFLLALAYHFAH